MSTLSVSRRNTKHTFGAGILPTQDEIDNAWALGLDLGRRGVMGQPKRSWAPEVRTAFLDGLAEGSATYCADSEAEFDREMAMLESLNSRRGRDW